MKNLVGAFLIMSLSGVANAGNGDVFGNEPPLRKKIEQKMNSREECIAFVRQVALAEGYPRPMPSDEAEDVGIKDQTGEWIGNSIYEPSQHLCIVHIWKHALN